MENTFGIGPILGHPVVFFLAVALLTMVSFNLAIDLSGRKVANRVPFTIVMSIVNAVVASLVISTFYRFFIPAALLVLTISMLLVEFAILTREDRFFLSMVSSGMLMILSCMYSFSVVLVGSFGLGLSLKLTVRDVMGLDSIVILLTCGYFLFLRYSGVIVFENMKKIFRQSDEGHLSLFFYCVADVFLLFSTHYTIRLVYRQAELYSIEELRSFMVAFLLKDALVLILSLIMLIFQSKNMGKLSQNQKLSTQLHKEETLRKRDREAPVLSFAINLSNSSVVEGREFINWELLDMELDENGKPVILGDRPCTEGDRPRTPEDEIHDGARSIISNLMSYCAHPDDCSNIIDNLTMDKYRSRLNVETAHVERMRLSPRRILECLRLDGSQIRNIRNHEGGYFWCESHTVVIESGENSDIIMFVEIVDVDEKASAEERLLLSATTDGLTGLLNRGTLTRRIEDYLKLEDTEGAIFIIDIDNFKSINDTYGHQMGDEVIKGIAGAIKKVFRKSDILGRLGGDEFMVFAVGLHQRTDARDKGSKLNELCHSVVADTTVKTSVSIGCSLYPADGSNYQELYSAADSVLYDVKEGGRNGCKVYGMKL